jgi:hypothetical protein
MCWSLALGQGCMWYQCLLQARSTHGLHHYLPDLTATAEVIADARLIIGASGVTTDPALARSRQATRRSWTRSSAPSLLTSFWAAQADLAATGTAPRCPAYLRDATR